MILIKLIGKTQVIEEITLGFKNTKKNSFKHLYCVVLWGLLVGDFHPFSVLIVK